MSEEAVMIESESEAVVPGEPGFRGVRDTAGGLAVFGTFALIGSALAMVIGLLMLRADGPARIGFMIGASLFALGALLKIWAALNFIRAGIEEGNYLIAKNAKQK